MFGDGSKLPVKLSGQGCVADTRMDMELCPDFKVKLLSLSNWLDANGPEARAIFTSDRGKLIKSNKVLGQIERKGNLFLLQPNVKPILAYYADNTTHSSGMSCSSALWTLWYKGNETDADHSQQSHSIG